MVAPVKKYFVWAVFLIAVIVQFYFPISSIAEKNDILENGVEYKIKTRPIDPADPFRGRYVAIDVSVLISDNCQNEAPGSDIYFIRLSTGEDGFAEVSEISIAPLEGEGVLRLNGRYYWRSWNNTVMLPYDRYYMRETGAPKAENAYRQQGADTYVSLRVKNNKGVISGLYVGDMRIEDYVRE